jgi:hypothetical protein
MIDRVEERFGLYPEKLAADRAYGSAEMLGWLVHERDYADQTARVTSSTLQPPPRTSESWLS